MTDTPQKPSWLRRHAVAIMLLLVVGVVLTVMLLRHPVGEAIRTHLRFCDNAAYKSALLQVQNHPEAQELLGSPITAQPFINGEFVTGSNPPAAQMAFAVSGPKGEGAVYLHASKDGNTWEVDMLILNLPEANRQLHLISNSQLGEM